MRKLEVNPVLPGTLLRMFPNRQGEDIFPRRTTWLGKDIPFEGTPVFEVKSYVFDEDGGHVTFKYGEGTYVVFGGGRMEDVKFPYPHPMFEVIDEADAERIRLDQNVLAVIEAATHPLARWMRRLNWLRSESLQVTRA